MNKRLFCSIAAGLFFICSLHASQCKGHFVNPITDICWDCLFPLTIGSSEVVKSQYPDTKNPGNPICSCPNKLQLLGVTIGYWEPFALVDVTRKPYCMVNLGCNYILKTRVLVVHKCPIRMGEAHFITCIGTNTL